MTKRLSPIVGFDAPPQLAGRNVSSRLPEVLDLGEIVFGYGKVDEREIVEPGELQPVREYRAASAAGFEHAKLANVVHHEGKVAPCPVLLAIPHGQAQARARGLPF